MKPTASVNAIPKEVAVKFCAEIREENRGKWYTFAGMQCKGCTTFSKGDSTKMCFNNGADYRGCNLVNARHDNKKEAR